VIPTVAEPVQKLEHPSFKEAFWFWLKLGFISFGGPTGQIAIMHTELVERRRWISNARFLHALNFCMLLPGPEATQLAIYIGWLLHRTWGGIVAGALFVLPSVLILYALSLTYVTFGNVPWIAAIFYGLKPAVLAIVASAVIRIGKKALKNEIMWALAAVAFIAIYFGKVPFPIIVFAAALFGFFGGKFWKEKFLISPEKPGTFQSVLGDESEPPAHAKPSFFRAIKITFVSVLLWFLPILFFAEWLGPQHVLVREGIFFSKAAMVTFGGAYAVLPYVSQQAIENHGWLSPVQMLDGLGLAETTPGPLIMVLQFVGFLGGWKFHEPLAPWFAATLGALITTWTTFVPCFLWILVGAPHIERLRGNLKLTAALSTVTAAVVGVILNLAVWFALHLIFPLPGAVDWFAVISATIAFLGLTFRNWGIVPVIFGAAIFGLIYKMWM
jgi:chromate transporter